MSVRFIGGANVVGVLAGTCHEAHIFAAPNGSSGTPSFRAMANADLPDSGVTANTYGSSTQVPVLTVNAKGVITGLNHEAVFYDSEALVEPIRIVRNFIKISDYAGSKDSLVLFREGRLESMIDNAREQCKDASYQPFPELERLTR